MKAQNILYNPVPPQNIDDPQALARYLFEELNRISNALEFVRYDVVLDELNVAPAKPREGLTVLADGTNWNPGSGAGVYTYYGGVWVKLG